MNGGKDIKIGHDKRPVSIIPLDEQPLFNISNGVRLTDEFGNPLVTKVDQFFVADASKERATSVVFSENPVDKYAVNRFVAVGVGTTTATYGANFDLDIEINNVGFTEIVCPVLQVGGGGIVGVGSTTSNVIRVLRANKSTVKLDGFPNILEVRVVNPIGLDRHKLYFSQADRGIVDDIAVADKVTGFGIPEGAYVLKKGYDRVTISEYVNVGIQTADVIFTRLQRVIYDADNVLKIAEVFKESSEVSTTLLGVNRAETQLSLFSNVSSYGIQKDDWETYQYNSGVSKLSWEQRVNRIYGKKYTARIEEETQESAIKLSAFPVPYSFPYGPIYQKIGLYDEKKYNRYLDFIRLGNAAYRYFISPDALSKGYTVAYATKFLDPNHVTIDDSGEIVYAKVEGKPDDFTFAFSKIDDWTDTWRLIDSTQLIDPVTGEKVSFGSLRTLLSLKGIPAPSGDTLPGYNSNYIRFSAIQSRRVFRYQPGRISGFTFGLKSSVEPIGGVALEWGIANTTDQYMFKIYAGQLSIIRRSTVPLSVDVLTRNGLDPTEITSIQINGKSYNTVQPYIPSGDPFDVTSGFGPYGNDNEQDERAIRYHTIEIPRDKFNGDPLNGNGPSGYNILPQNVTMWKIEFGWYGAIGARFYAYIPAGTGDARWVVVHTLVIENQLTGPCLEDSYFRFKYTLNCFNNSRITQPQFLYKYGASYYIDGGDEGTSQIYSVSTGLNPKQINAANETTVFGVRPKDIFTSVTGAGATERTVEIANRKLILPTKFNMTTNALTEVKVKTCVGCKGHAHVITPGVGSTISGREIDLEFIQSNTVSGIGASFTTDDIGSKLIAPSIFNAYVHSLVGDPEETHFGKDYYSSVNIYGWGSGLDGYPNYNTNTDETSGGRRIGGALVKDYAQAGITTTIKISNPSSTPPVDGTYPHKVRLSSYNDVHFASKQKLSGSKIKIQFLNPRPKDGALPSQNTHWSDFLIGVTDREPTISGSDLVGWDADVLSWMDYTESGGISPVPATSGMTTTILPNQNILFGESTHTWGGMNEDGVEVNERWSPSEYRVRMAEDVRIPVVPNPDGQESGGVCSTVEIEVGEKSDIAKDVLYLAPTTNVPDGTTSTQPHEYLIVQGTFGGGITDWLNGQVVFQNADGSINTTTAVFDESTPTSTNNAAYFGGTDIQYIRIRTSGGQLFPGNKSGLELIGRTVKLTGNKLNQIKTKLFTYAVYPLYLVGKLRDNSKINNIMVTEISGNFQKTTSPKLAITENSNGTIDIVGGDGSNTQIPPPNFVPIDRLSSATVDLQNLRVLRESVTKDIFYIGQDQTKEVDMTKVFGVDRNVITPDNNNIEATFITAKSLSGSTDKFIQSSLNFKEQ